MRGETQDHVVDLAKMVFQSTLPMRGETTGRGLKRRSPAISIHSPHAGRDFLDGILGKYAKDFNPLSPCGERRWVMRSNGHLSLFQSTLPMRGETELISQGATLVSFQSTLPMRGETRMSFPMMRSSRFQSTLPMRGETKRLSAFSVYGDISIHSPHAGRDLLSVSLRR